MRRLLCGVIALAAIAATTSDAEARWFRYRCCPVSCCQPTSCYTACRVERETCYRTIYETCYEPEQVTCYRNVTETVWEDVEQTC